MDPSINASPQSLPTQKSPPFLALSDFMAQATPGSEATNTSDKPASPGVDSAPAGRVGDSEQNPPSQNETRPETSVEARAETPRRVSRETRSQDAEPRPSTQKDDTPPPTDWLATRQQLLPRKSQGKKGDWIRGWSQAVSNHGEETYCGCSEPIENGTGFSRGRKPKTSTQLADNVRAILQRTASPSSSTHKTKPSTPATPADPEVCRHCLRPPSPPLSTRGSPSRRAADRLGPPFLPGTLTKRFSELFLRVRNSRSSSPPPGAIKSTARRGKHTPDPEPEAPWPEECQPRWAATGPGHKRLLVRPSSQPVSAPVQGTGAGEKVKSGRVRASGDGGGRGWFSKGHSRSRTKGSFLPTTSMGVRAPISPPSSSSGDIDGISDSDAEGPRMPGLSRSMSRLQRAAAMLQRATTRSKD